MRAGEDSTLSPTTISPADGLDEAGDQPQGRGLAAARRAQQADQLAVLDRERHVVDDRERAVALGQIRAIRPTPRLPSQIATGGGLYRSRLRLLNS